ncbi:hypothetical protein CAP36_05160 [Chitinophagaceae bacterium IBVUCB2]|nr:hypothetical protein CAP36_05160 [Chitinophagaceae bacterium IBVUCB2]
MKNVRRRYYYQPNHHWQLLKILTGNIIPYRMATVAEEAGVGVTGKDFCSFSGFAGLALQL